MNAQIKTPEKELSDEGVDNLSDAELKTLVIRMFKEKIEFGRKMKEELKAMQSEIYREPSVKGRKSGLNDLEQQKERNIQLEQSEETRIQKNEERLRNLWDNFKHSNI